MSTHEFPRQPEPRPATPAGTPARALDEFRRLGYRAVDLAADYLAHTRERPVFTPMQPDERRALLEQPLPTAGTQADRLLDVVRDEIFVHPMGNGHPRFFGWVNSPPDPLGVLAELLAAALDPSCAGGDHAAIYVERCVVRWLMELVGFPVEGSMGLLVSGGSMASLTCLAAARQRAATRLGVAVRETGLHALPPLVLYRAEEGHTCIAKAVELLGLGREAMRTVRVDDGFRLDLDDLRAAVQADRAAGRYPFCVVASAGTVNTGSIDPLEALADFCAAEDLWLHVDGAYGALGILDPDLTARYAGMERADSLALDPHKWLSVPVECGCALVRDGALLRETFSLVPPYLRTDEGRGFGGLPWFSEYGFQQTRGFRALKLWIVLAAHGRDGLAARIARHNALARHLAALIEAAPDLELMAPVTLSIVVFRYRPPAVTAAQELDALNRALMEDVQAGGEAFITGTMIGGRAALRACILHYDTGEADVEALVDVVRQEGARLVDREPGAAPGR
jgi:glutamate/tyrosine decarboxylase-like PLP-dependent enzyme